MVVENANKRQRDRNIRDIARMVVENNRERNLIKLANMVKKNKTQRNVGNNYKIDNRDIRGIVELVKVNKNIRISPNVFSIRQIRTNQRFNYNEYIYDVKIGPDNMSSLPEFLINLRFN
jgi:hypothetical protein